MPFSWIQAAEVRSRLRRSWKPRAVYRKASRTRRCGWHHGHSAGQPSLRVRRKTDGTFESTSITNAHFKALEMPSMRTVRDMPKIHIPSGQLIPSESSLEYTATSCVRDDVAGETYGEREISGVTQASATLS